MDAFFESLDPVWIALIGVAIEIVLVAVFVRALARRIAPEPPQQPMAAFIVFWILRSTSLLVLLLLAGVTLGGDSCALPHTTESLSLGELQSWLREEHAELGRLRDVVFALLFFGAMQVVLVGRIIPVRRVPSPAKAPG